MKILFALILSLIPSFGAAQTLDYNIANQSFPAFRADLNAHLSAIVQQNPGPTAPATTFPYMAWADTSAAAPILRYRNAANSGWAAAFRIDPSSTMWLGGITTNAATITGGSINGAAIGATNPAAMTATALTASSVLVAASEFPALDLRSGVANDAFKATRLVRGSANFAVTTVNSSGGFVSTNYDIALGASGATAHSFRIADAERLSVTGTTTRVTATGGGGSGFLVDLTNASGFGAAGLDFSSTTEVSGSLQQPVLRPRSSGGHLLGSPSFRWGNAYLSVGPNVASDARLKHDVGDIAGAECRVAERIQHRRYKLNDGDGRWRFGAIAQEVIAAFDAEGLDWRDYAIVSGSDETSFGVVYDELQSLKLACM